MATNQNSKNNVLYFLSWRTDDQEMARFHRETKKKNRFERALQTDRHTYIQTESTTKNSRLLAGAESINCIFLTIGVTYRHQQLNSGTGI